MPDHLRGRTRVMDARGDEHSPLAIDDERSLIVRHIDRIPTCC
jgi:hypothetical protein